MAEKQYPEFPPHIAQAWRYLELMLRGAQEVENTPNFFDHLYRQIKFIDKTAQADPLMRALMDAALGVIEDRAKERASA